MKILLLIILSLIAISAVFLLKAVPQSLAYHQFADKRTIGAIPNFWNVITNLPFLLTGAIGLVKVSQSRAFGGIKIIYILLFTGVVLTGFGSAYYHYYPDNNTLVYDRIPMTVVFMSLLSATVAEFISTKGGVLLLIPLLALGVYSVVYWHNTELQGAGDLRWYGLVQFYPVVIIPVILLLFPGSHYTRGVRQLAMVVIWYIIAKLFELFDKQVYAITHVLSGHSLKHLAAAVSTGYLVALYCAKHMNKVKRQVA